MRRYETIAIIDPDLSEDDRQPVLDRVEGLIPQQDGLLVETDQWGARKLAYEIKKKVRGFYVRFDYCGTGALVNEIERFFRIDDRVLKYMTVLQDDKIDIEKIKEQITAAAALKQEETATEAETQVAAEAAESAAASETVDETATAEDETDEKPAADDEPEDQPATEEKTDEATADEATADEATAEDEPAKTETADQDAEAEKK